MVDFECLSDHLMFIYCQAQLSSLKPQLKLSFAIFPLLLHPPGKVFKAQVKTKLQPQLAEISLTAKLS